MPELNNTDESIQNNGIPEISLAISANEGLTNAVDKTLTADGEAADAKTVGDKFDEITQDLIPDLAATLAEAVLYEAEQTERTDAEKKQALSNIGGVGTVSGQELTDAQKTYARTNIGAAGQGDAVMVTTGLNSTGKQTVLENIGAVGVSAQTLTDAQKKQVLKNIGAVGVVEQTGSTGYTSAEKTQARTNIGAIGAGEAVDVTTGLNAEQKASVRTNIGAISEDDATTLIEAMQSFPVVVTENLQAQMLTVLDGRITENHVVAATSVVHTDDVTWTTGDGQVTVSCPNGIPGMILMIGKIRTN